MTTFFPPIHTWLIPENVIMESLLEMAKDGIEGNESLVLWLGRRNNGQAEVMHIIALRGPGIIKRPNFLRVEPELLNDVTDLAIDLGVVLIGQMHSHGREYGTNLSPTDRAYGCAVPYYLSVVAPNYGMTTGIRMVDCGVNVFEPDKGYVHLSPVEVMKCIRIFPKFRISIFKVGEEQL